ncbi:hypothetical protein BDQ12DRAFT_623993 [Crucibulum laeve]|uniref:Zn(2)-C6 fungal-type domain-containing protein n=1 Tax=Crucibulum laeve TaxID=68775 RepID=A0A5C3MDL8_9AGAR|nr:hypothetical protein BDQ12DRAFT_623993 [Crucibulum laeve]
MSPRGSSSASASSSSNARNASAPYSRRPTSQPKSSRQQFSACGACRMRRVRCDLKDLPIASAGPHPACSNCKERGIKCVDEFADVKAVKLLRRGRRLQQVEAIYGKTADAEGGSSSPPATRLPSLIPTLQPDFFASPFWHWFTLQRPLLDADEFSARFFAHTKGTQSLGNEGGLIAMLLVVWAASFGVDEYGRLEGGDHESSSNQADASTSVDGNVKREDTNDRGRKRGRESLPGHTRRDRKERTESMLREVLELIDFHGVMRRPTLDGVRSLLLILPLLEDAQPLERLAIHEAALSQVQSLCATASSSIGSSSAFPNTVDDALARARIFWYAHTQEGISTGTRGGRFVLDIEDLETFQRTLPPLNFSGGGINSPSSPLSVDASATLPSGSASSESFLELINTMSLPLNLSGVCRKIHTVLTGPKAMRRAEEHGLIDANGMREIWRELDHCWQEFNSLQRDAANDDHPAIRMNTERFVAGWQIFIFECHNIIREALKQHIASAPTQVSYPASSRPSSHSSTSSPYLPPLHLHAIAARKCTSLLPSIINIIKRQLGSSGLFKWDAGLVRDGCFFAGYLAASMDGDAIYTSVDDRYSKSEDQIHFATEEAITICVSALTEMNWAYSKTEEREEAIKMIWRGPSLDQSSQSNFSTHLPEPHAAHYRQTQVNLQHRPLQNIPASFSENGDRPLLPPLALYTSARRSESAPTTACTTDGSGANGWPSYTPPGTASTTSTGTGFSARGSPVFNDIAPGFKGHLDDSSFYHGAADLDPFSFHAPMTDALVRGSPALGSVTGYHRGSPIDSQAVATAGSSSTYLAGTYTGVNVMGHGAGDFNGCPQFGDNCNASYH